MVRVLWAELLSNDEVLMKIKNNKEIYTCNKKSIAEMSERHTKDKGLENLKLTGYTGRTVLY